MFCSLFFNQRLNVLALFRTETANNFARCIAANHLKNLARFIEDDVGSQQVSLELFTLLAKKFSHEDLSNCMPSCEVLIPW